MKRSSDHSLPRELEDIAGQLSTHRAQLTPLELDQIKLQSRARAAGKPSIKINREERIFMRTRVNILAVLVAGIVFSGAGAAMGISGLASDNGAGNAQYPNATIPTTQGNNVGVQGSNTTLGGNQGNEVEVAGANAHSNGSAPAGAGVAGANASAPSA